QKRGKPTGKKWPASQYGGELLSKDGMLRTSTSSGYESPVSYRDALEAEERAPAKGGSTFHTEQETSPWGMVVLPGISEIAGVTVVNSGGGQNGGRQAPLRIWLSEDGKEFHQVYASGAAQAEWECKLNTPMKAKYVKVGREPDQRNEYFHLSKILVYGKKLY
ncbi:MAG: discoidin domain-containing protein, partial [Kiritimatiellae bacterium]|nr:discoidin domain-containing protein [Kiritimatiellia bacterium]